ncbi:MAG: hypothetical protein R3F56_04865 [Planctomycetota bacterium]
MRSLLTRTILLPLVSVGLAAQAGADRRPSGHETAPIALGSVLDEARARVLDGLEFDAPGDGRIWARGATYKASFGEEGFVYVPAFGSRAPRNFPVHFELRSVRAGGHDVPFATAAQPRREGTRVTLDRGAVREVYDLQAGAIEQTFVVEAGPGDVEVELAVDTELVGQPGADGGVQFAHELGRVRYGTAYLVSPTRKAPITTVLGARTLTLRVPAGLRGTGPVVIDPILTTETVAGTGVNDCSNPDVAYDASTDRYAVTWEYAFSATDTDVYVELRNGDGSAVPGSQAAIDLSTYRHQRPRIANLATFDRFLVVTERLVVGGVASQWSVWGRTYDAVLPVTTGAQFQINDPALPGDHREPDVGGDSGSGAAWTVVWSYTRTVSDFGIYSQQVRDNSTLYGTRQSYGAGTHPRISRTNGNGTASLPRWMVVFSARIGNNSSDIFGCAVGLSGNRLIGNYVDGSPIGEDFYPEVSSPLEGGSAPTFMVTYWRQSGALMGTTIDSTLHTVIPPTDLTQTFGFNGLLPRVESDGCRFALTYTENDTAYIATLAPANRVFRLHEPPVAFTGRLAAGPRLVAKRSGGGVRTDYGVVFTDITSGPSRIAVATYAGHAPSGGFRRRATGCGGLALAETGRPFLGEEVRFAVSNQGADPVGLLLGTPIAASPLCPTCSLGVDLRGPLVQVIGPSLVLPIPRLAYLVGRTLATQAYAVGSGTCVAALRLSDTVDFTVQ